MADPKIVRRVILLCLFLASAEFVLRGPVRTIRFGDFTDFSGMYVASREWVAGGDPYQSSEFLRTWMSSGGEFFVNRGSDANLRPAYPPSSLPVLAPFSFFSWITARDLFLLLSVGMFPFLLWGVLRLGRLHWSETLAPLTCAFGLALAPWHAAIAGQSLSAPVIELATIGTALESEIGGGVLTGLALSLKPQLAIWFVLFDLAKGRWTRLVWESGLFALLMALALLRMPHGWLTTYLENLRYFFAIGDVNDFSLHNPSRFELLNLQVIFYYLTRIYRLANILAWVSGAALIILWARRKFESDSGQLATIVLIGLLPLYQRIYNAGVIVLLLPYALSHWSETKGKVLVGACAIFLIPGTAILQTLHKRGAIGDAVWNGSWWFNLFVGTYSTWVLLGIVAVLLSWREPFPLREHQDTL